MNSDTKDFLFELGTQELPPKLLTNLSQQLSNDLTKQLKAQQLSFKDIKTFASPRRLGLLVSQLSTQQADKNIDKKGPAVGAPEQAIMGFAKSVGVGSVDELNIKTLANKDYYFYQKKQKGQATTQLLSHIMPAVVANISQDRMMRWGVGDEVFIRPVQWLVALLGDSVVPMSILGLDSAQQTQGLRFANINHAQIQQASDYEAVLSELGIEANFEQRKTLIKQQINQLSQENNLKVSVDEGLLNEVCALVEAPKTFIGHFDKKFLNLPSEVLILAMESHQKYFPVFSNKGKLQNSFVAVANKTDLEQDLSTVISGNERVIHPRLSDAEFFWQEDSLKTLEERLNQLNSLAFMQSLGSVFDKVKRLETLSNIVAPMLGLDQKHLARSALLSKSDLISNMVVEFPKLQGVMGGYYANNDGEANEVVQAIAQQYYPRYSGDTLPNTDLGCVLSLLDKIDTIAGIYGLGKIPTGSKDPYALRRLALGVVRIVVEKQININLKTLLESALNLHNKAVDKQAKILQGIIDFMLERLRAYYLEKNISTSVYNAISLNADYSLTDFNQRIIALGLFNSQPESKNLITLNKRIANTLKKASTNQAFEANLLTDAAEVALFRSVDALKNKTIKDYGQRMLDLCALEPIIDDFFDSVMVNVEDDIIKNNRLQLLTKTQALFLSIADISKL